MRLPTDRSTAWPPRATRRGFSLIELVIVVAIFSLLTAIGVTLASKQLPRWKARQAAMDFVQHAETCRSLAISFGRECRILLLTFDDTPATEGSDAGAYRVQLAMANVAGSWDTLPVDSDIDNSDDSKGQGEIDIASRSNAFFQRSVSILDWGTIAGPGSGNSNALVFDSRGFLTNPSSDFTDGTISVTFINKKIRVEDDVNDAYTVSVARSGMANLDSSLRSGDEFKNAGVSSGTSYSSDSPFGLP